MLDPVHLTKGACVSLQYRQVRKHAVPRVLHPTVSGVVVDFSDKAVLFLPADEAKPVIIPLKSIERINHFLPGESPEAKLFTARDMQDHIRANNRRVPVDMINNPEPMG